PYLLPAEEKRVLGAKRKCERRRLREMKECELCGKPASMYCESDQASLCWDCDEKVHCANFLVARHSRSLLCHVCQSVTPWKAEGPKLTPTVSVCVGCAANNIRSICDAESEVEPVNDGDDDDDENGDDDDGDDSYDEDPDADDEGENQVVPWACASSPPPPPAASSSSDEGDGEESSTAISALKRVRENADVDSDVSVLTFPDFTCKRTFPILSHVFLINVLRPNQLPET
ncbi:hypothetical protein F2P56_005303, partial [Juglans regia]